MMMMMTQCWRDGISDDEMEWFEDLKGTNSVASDGILGSSENSVDQLRRLAFVTSLHDGTHGF